MSNRHKAGLERIRQIIEETEPIDMGDFESVPLGFTREIYDITHAALIGGDVYGNKIVLGMSLRDYFAAATLSGFREEDFKTYKEQAEAAYRSADAMLKERGDD